MLLDSWKRSSHKDASLLIWLMLRVCESSNCRRLLMSMTRSCVSGNASDRGPEEGCERLAAG